MAIAAKKTVHVDLGSKYAEQGRIAAQMAASPKVKAFLTDDSPYQEPRIASFIAKAGKNMGKPLYRWSFGHKANPAWSRQYDYTDLCLVLDNIEEAKAARIYLKSMQPK